MRAVQAPWRIQPGGSRREAKCTCSSVSPSAIEAENLRVAVHGGEEILKGVDMSVPRGSLYMLVGPNGCGKVRNKMRLIFHLFTGTHGRVGETFF